MFDEHRTSDHPVPVMAGGRHGAGKTMAMQVAEHRHTAGDIIALTADDLRLLHPRYEDLMREDPLLMVDATTQATSVWMQMAYEYARNPGHQYSLMMEGTFRVPAATLLDAERFAEAGVSVELALSVRQERSRLEPLHRYLPAAHAQPGRCVFADRHDEAYRMVAATVEAAEASPHIQRVTVTNRSGADLYVNSRGPDGRLTAEARGAQVVQEERNRPFPPEEARGWLIRHAETLIAFAAAGEVNDTWGDSKSAITLQTLVDEPLQLGSALPCRLESEQGLASASVASPRPKRPPAAVEMSPTVHVQADGQTTVWAGGQEGVWPTKGAAVRHRMSWRTALLRGQEEQWRTGRCSGGCPPYRAWG
ncbi:zeta toxin family protein [Streptomyces sp. NBC_01240]|uniref:zeta toxin family protein n=1 Tax=Streptomyces sp. NBC_01240 TaxID=2903793 RepID=UPI002E0D6F0A|nr:zeta toxin family protein [Streptomyces sp. NBC_01240]